MARNLGDLSKGTLFKNGEKIAAPDGLWKIFKVTLMEMDGYEQNAISRGVDPKLDRVKFVDRIIKRIRENPELMFVQTNDGNTLGMWAVIMGFQEIGIEALKYDSRGLENNYGLNIVVEAADSRFYNDEFIEEVAKNNPELLTSILKDSGAMSVQYLIERLERPAYRSAIKAAINESPEIATCVDKNGNTLGHYLVETGDKDLIRFYLVEHAQRERNGVDSMGRTVASLCCLDPELQSLTAEIRDGFGTLESGLYGEALSRLTQFVNGEIKLKELEDDALLEDGVSACFCDAIAEKVKTIIMEDAKENGVPTDASGWLKREIKKEYADKVMENTQAKVDQFLKMRESAKARKTARVAGIDERTSAALEDI